MDFEYEVNGKIYEAAFPGAQDIALQTVLKELNVRENGEKLYANTAEDDFFSGIVSVVSTNEEVARVDKNWMIRVLKDGDAQIVITMQDGAVFSIDVRAEGETEVTADNVAISTVGELYLPDDAKAKAAVVNGEQAIEAVKAETGEETEYTVFDISLENVDAEKYEEGFEVTVALDSNITGKDFRLYHVHDGQMEDITASLTLEGPVDENGVRNLSGFTFQTGDFSEFVLSYTVDFFYGEYEYHMRGGASISLSELFRLLNIQEDAADAETVVFSNPELLEVVRTESDWMLNSLSAFGSEETLTVTMKDGGIITIHVLDAIQNGYESLVTAATDGLNFSVVDKGESTATYNTSTQTYDLQLAMDFTIPSDHIKEGYRKYDLEFNSDIQVPQEYLDREYSAYDSITGEESFKYRLFKDGDTYHMLVEFTEDYVNGMKESSRTIGKNKATLDITVGSQTLKEDGSLNIDVVDNKEVSVTPDKITYPEGTDGKHDINVTKQFGGYDKTTNEMTYTLIVTSSMGTAGPITVQDALSVMSGDSITVNDVQVTSVKTGVGNEYYLDNVNQQLTAGTDYTATASTDNTGLTITLPQAAGADGQNNKTVYLINYKYTLSGVGDDFESNGKNSVTASSGNIGKTAEAYWNISQSGIALNKTGQYDNSTGKITWTITVTNNKSSDIPLQDDALKGLAISDLTITPAETLTFNSTTGTLTIPAGKSYTITYTTTPTISDPTVATDVTNTAVAGEGEGQKTVVPSVSVPAELTVSKEVASVSRNGDRAIITWRVKIHVPQTGFVGGTTLTDTLGFQQDWQNYDNYASFTDTQKDALVAALQSYFGDGLVVDSYTQAGAETDQYGNTTRTAAQLVMKFNADWPESGITSEYTGKDVIIEYQTSADLSALSSDNNSFSNIFKVNNLSAEASHSFKERVVKMSNPGNAANVTTAAVNSENNKLHWYIQVALEEDATSVSIEDTLPEGLTVTAIRMGNGPYNLIGLVETSAGTWAGETATDWSNGVPAWSSTYMSDATPSATVSGQTVTVSLTANGSSVPDYFQENKVFYFYIEAEIDESQFPDTGSVTNNYTNTASATVNNSPYGSDDQTQQVTLKTEIVDKSGDSSVWNADNNAHELSYVVDINPTGGTIAGADGEITLTDHIEYYKTVKDNAGNDHKVSLNLKEGSVKLQRKDSNGQWVDIPPTEGWGYTLNEDVATASDNIKAKEINVYGIPDNMILRFVYTYNVEVDGLAKNASVNLGAIKNTATLKAAVEESSSHTETKTWQNIQGSASTDSTGSLTVVKVQEGNYAITLPDTLFVLEKFVPAASGGDTAGTWEVVTAYGSTISGTGDYSSFKVYKSNANGKVVIAADTALLGGADYFQYDQLYRVREYEARDGYTLDGLNPEAVYFYFGQTVTPENVSSELAGYHYSGGSSHADDLIRETDTIYMTNKRLTDTITAGKQWNSSTLWPSEVQSITLELQKNGQTLSAPSSYSVVNDGKYYTHDDTGYTNPWTNPQILTASNPQAKWEKLDINPNDSNPFAGYRVVETAISYDGSTLTRQDAGTNQYQWVNASGEVLYETFGGTVTGGSATIVNMSKTKLDVAKVWGTQQSDTGIKVIMTLTSQERLYAQNGVIENPLPNWGANYSPVSGIAAIELDGTQDEIETTAWNASFGTLDKFRFDESTGRLYEIRYSVQERVLDNTGRDITDRYLVTLSYTKDGAAVTAADPDYDKVTVTNSDNTGKLLVHKVWVRRQLQEGETKLPDLPNEIYISLERYYEDGEGVQHNDTDFNADHRGIQILRTDSFGSYTEWAKLFENLQRQIVVDGTAYNYRYVVKEDTLDNFTTAYSGNLAVVSDVNVNEITVTNKEKEERHEKEDIDIQLKKFFANQSGTVVSTIPTDASATFRLYRYVAIERGTVDSTGEEPVFIKDDNTSQSSAPDEEFNAAANDAAYSLTYPTNGTVKDDGTNQYVELNWSDLPINETYIRDDTYTKYIYEYYLVETASSNSSDSQISYIVTWLPADGTNNGELYGSVIKPITGESYGVTATVGDETTTTKIAQVKNVESKNSFTVRKYWYGLEEENMPGIVFTFKGQSNNTWTDISTFGTSTNGASVTGNSTFTKADGTTFQGYLLNNDNEWNITFTIMPSGYSKIDALEIGYLTKDANGNEVVQEFDSQYFETSNRYNYSTESQKYIDISGYTYSDFRNTFQNNWHETNNNYGTIGICNAPIQTGGQLYLQKKWYKMTDGDSFQFGDFTAGYTGQLNGQGKEAYIVMQVYQRPYWAMLSGIKHPGEYVTDWVAFNDPIKYSVSEVIANGFAWNGGGGQWHLQIQNDVNMPLYGYMFNEDGVAELVMYDYKWVEVSQIPGSDGISYRTYQTGYPNEPENHKDDPDYYGTWNGKQIIENYETGLLKLIKDWKVTDESSKASKIFFAVTDSLGRDVARMVYESEYKEYYGVTADQVAYVRELDKYVFVLDVGDANEQNANRWELLISGLDLVEEINPETHVGHGEINYTVEEVGAEFANGTVRSVTDATYPYNASYYTRVRNGNEQFAGSTANADERLTASGLQLDSGASYNSSGSLTTARVVNSDEPTTQLTVQKKWGDGTTYPNESMKVVLNIEQRRQKTDEHNQPLWDDGTENGTTVYTDGRSPKWNSDWQAAEGTNRVSVTLPLSGYSGANAWTYTWKGLPIYKVTGEMGAQQETQAHDILWYRVVEYSTPGWTSGQLSVSGGTNTVTTGDDVSATGNKVSPISAELTNSVDNTNIHIEKKWTNAYANEGDQSETWGTDQTIKWPEGYAIDYKVVRHAWYLSASEGESEVVNYPEDENRDPDAPTSYDQKNVTYSRVFEVEDWKVDPFMTGSLSAINPSYDLTGQPKGEIKTTDDNPPTGLAKNTTYVVEYVYEIVETAITTPYGTQTVNVSVESSDKNENGTYNKENGIVLGDATIVNDLTDIEVQKVWDDDYDHSGDTVTVQLYRSNQRPEGAVPVDTKELTVKVKDFTGGPRIDLTSGTITVTVSGDDGYTYTRTLAPDSWEVNLTVPDVSSDTGMNINYTVNVSAVDGEIISSASVNGSGTVQAGETVELTAVMTEQQIIETFTLKFDVNYWQEAWGSWSQTSAPSDGYFTVKVKNDKTNEEYEIPSFNNSNGWGSSYAGLELDKTDIEGNSITYSISIINRDENILNGVNFNNGSPQQLHGEDVEGDQYTIHFAGQLKQQPQGGSGNEQADGTVIWNYNGNQSKTTFTPGESIVVTINVTNGWGNVDVTFTPSEGTAETKRIYTNTGDGTGWGEHSVEYKLPDSGYVTISFNEIWEFDSVTVKSKVAGSRGLRTMMKAAPMLAAAPALTATPPEPKTFPIAGKGDKTPIDAVAVGDPITLSVDNWSHLWENLPTVDEDGNPVYYYVRELTANVDGSTTSISTLYDYVKHDDDDARKGYAIVKVTNTTVQEEKEEATGSVTFGVEKIFLNGDGSWPEDGFQFKLSQPTDDSEHSSDKTILSSPEIITITETNGTATFGSIEFQYKKNSESTIDQTGTYWFLIEEVLPEGVTKSNPVKDGIRYDTSKHYIKVEVNYTQGSTELSVVKTPTPDENKPDVTFTNEKLKETSAKKEWHDIGDNKVEWPNDLSITVTLHRKDSEGNVDSTFVPEFTIGKNDLIVDKVIAGIGEGAPVLIITKADSEQKEYEFKVKDLPAFSDNGKEYTYYFIETQVIGYQTPLYKKDSMTSEIGALDGYSVINRPQDSYVLPQTGGIGTSLFTTLGAILSGTSGAALVLKKRKEE